MDNINKLGRIFLLFCLSLTISCPSFADDFEGLKWLPFLNANIKRFQPDKACPQNQIIDLKFNKKEQQIDASIGEVSWDLDCQTKSTVSDNSQSKPQLLSQQIPILLKQLSILPDLKFDIEAVNLFSKFIKVAITSQVSIKKKASQFTITLTNEILESNLSLNLHDNKLIVDAEIQLDKLTNYLHLNDKQSLYLNNPLLLTYQSDVDEWQKGSFQANWQGELSVYSENADLSIQGQLDLLKQQIKVTNLAANVKNILIPVSQQQDWQTAYIKLKNSDVMIFNYGHKRIESLPIQMRVGTSQLLTKVERGQSKRIRVDKQKLPPLYIESKIAGNETLLNFDWRVSTLNQTLTAESQLTPQSVSLKIQNNSLDIKSLVDAGQQYFEQLAPFKLEQGLLNLDILANYNRLKKTTMLQSQLSTTDIIGNHEEITFDGVNLESDLHYLFDEQNNLSIVKDKQRLKIANLFVGVPIQAIQVDASLEGGKPVIQHFKSRLLGGRVDFDDFKIQAPSQTILNVSGLSLAQIIKYSAYPEITTKGIIDAMLPLTLTQAGPEITEGIIFARAPGGYIQVPENTVLKAMGRGNPAFTLTMQILSNFEFDTLSGKLGYTSDGESDLKVEIKGVSPTVSGTQPVHFNYSHNENILKLLKSLRFNDELARDIKERY